MKPTFTSIRSSSVCFPFCYSALPNRVRQVRFLKESFSVDIKMYQSENAKQHTKHTKTYRTCIHIIWCQQRLQYLISTSLSRYPNLANLMKLLLSFLRFRIYWSIHWSMRLTWLSNIVTIACLIEFGRKFVTYPPTPQLHRVRFISHVLSFACYFNYFVNILKTKTNKGKVIIIRVLDWRNCLRNRCSDTEPWMLGYANIYVVNYFRSQKNASGWLCFRIFTARIYEVRL